MTDTTLPFMMEIPTGEVEITSDSDVSQSGELLIMKLRSCTEFNMQ